MPIRLMVIDDSPVTRAMLGELLVGHNDIALVCSVASLERASDLIKSHRPDVLLLDAEMPHMASLDFLSRLMRLRPMPVVALASLSAEGFEATMGALELGAVDVVARGAQQGGLAGLGEEICTKIRAAYTVRVRTLDAPVPPVHSRRLSSASSLASAHDHRLLALGGGMGSVEGLRVILSALPKDVPGILVSVPLPSPFMGPFARRLDTVCSVRVKLAEDGEPVLSGHVYLAPGEGSLAVTRERRGYLLGLADRDVPHPSPVDRLFKSVAAAAAGPAVGILLSGHGTDGAEGLLALRNAGAYTMAQDHASCTSFALPRAALALGAAHETVGLRDIPEQMLAWLDLQEHRLLHAV